MTSLSDSKYSKMHTWRFYHWLWQYLKILLEFLQPHMLPLVSVAGNDLSGPGWLSIYSALTNSSLLPLISERAPSLCSKLFPSLFVFWSQWVCWGLLSPVVAISQVLLICYLIYSELWVKKMIFILSTSNVSELVETVSTRWWGQGID